MRREDSRAVRPTFGSGSAGTFNRKPLACAFQTSLPKGTYFTETTSPKRQRVRAFRSVRNALAGASGL